ERPARMPLMVICTSRNSLPEEAGQELRLGPLSEVNMADFVSHRSRTQSLSRKQQEHVLQLSHGVPLYALLLMRQTVNDLSLDHSCRLTDAICVAMTRLPPAALEVAQLAALMDARPDVCALGRVLAMSEDVAREAISCLQDAGILMESAKAGLESPMIVKLALERMTPRKTRQRLHTLIARHL